MREINQYRETAKVFTDAIRILAAKPENIDNLESYLSHHFDKWLELWANTPENLSYELKNFADMQI